MVLSWQGFVCHHSGDIWQCLEMVLVMTCRDYALGILWIETRGVQDKTPPPRITGLETSAVPEVEKPLAGRAGPAAGTLGCLAHSHCFLLAEPRHRN